MSMTSMLVQAQMYWGEHVDGDHMRWWVPVVWLVSVAIVGVAAVAVLRRWPGVGARGEPPRAGGAARTILAERFARGEISTDELRERSAALDEVERPRS